MPKRSKPDQVEGDGQGLEPIAEPLDDVVMDPPAVPEPVPAGMARVCLRPGADFESFTDPETQLVVTSTPATVPLAKVGSACRFEPDVIVEEDEHERP